MTHKIYINVTKAGKRGLLYDVDFEGQKICQSTTIPFLDGCRVLRDRGLSGPVEMWDAVRPYPRMRGIVEKTAGLTVADGGRGITRLQKYVSRYAEAAKDSDLD